MSERTRFYSGRRFLFRTALPVLCGAFVLAAGGFAALEWSVEATDRAAVDRQAALMSVVVENLRDAVAHDQESVTVWDDAVLAMRNLAEPKWIDTNLGTWMHTYFGHDGAYILDSTNVPIYAYEHGGVAPLTTWAHVRDVAVPLAARLRQRLRDGDDEGISARTLSLGESDIGFDAGRPAVISVKPIVSDTGEIAQTPGTEYLHVAVRHLDGDFLQELASRYLFDDLVYTPVLTPHSGREAFPIRNAAGRGVGYFVWRPFSPGTRVFADVAPIAAGGLGLLVLAVAAALLSSHRRAVAEREAAERIHHLAHHDTLTGLPNRNALDRRLGAALAAAQGTGALLYVDLDHFKVVNDTLGHAVGDLVVRAAAERIEAICGDDAFRIGGDEFVAIVGGRRVREAVAMAEAIVAALAAPVLIGGVHAFVGASVGVAPFAEVGTDGSELFRKADVALYQAKAAGRGRVAVYDTALDAEMRRRAALDRDLRRALAAPEQFEVHYQPIVDAATHAVVGVEALARWRHPEHGPIPPAEFIPVAEASGLIRDIGALVLDAACRAAAKWRIATVAVNVSAVQLRDAEFPGTVADVLQRTGLPPETLEIEITETAWLDPSGHGADTVAALRALGVRFALDDFGTGFSSIGRLNEAVFDRIKIDQSFVRSVLASPGDAAIVRAILDLASAKGLKTTAEGVETAEVAEHLAQIGCDELQGYHFGRPMPFAEADARLRPGATPGETF